MTMRAHRPDDGFVAWITELCGRLDRGDLAGHPPVDFGDGTCALPAERTVEIMLAELAGFEDMTSDEAAEPINVARRVALLDDFHRLRFLIR